MARQLERDEYYLHLFTKEQPDLNWENLQTRKAIYETAIEYWLKKGVDGFRVDVVSVYSTDPSFPDAKATDPGAETQWPFEHCLNGPRIHEFLKEIRRDVLIKYGDDVLIVVECLMTEPDESLRYVAAREKELNMVFDFSMMYVGMGTEDGAMKTTASGPAGAEDCGGEDAVVESGHRCLDKCLRGES